MPASASEGLCPRCLLEAASAPTEAWTQAIVAGQVPSVAQVAAAFPELEVMEFIGAGGMGAVYRARQPKLDRWVALKILPAPLGRDPAFAERFLREARVLARLHHPRIVTVFDFGQAGEFFYLLMEYVDGVNLRQAMRAGRFTPAQALVLVPQICEALQFAHDSGVMHRDIKPENILLDSQGRVKIADFGIAKLLDDAPRDVRLTGTGAAVGTPQYMAPEQIERPEDVDHRADVYSLGVVFYELLTGELPLGRFAPPSSKVGTDLDVRIDEIVLRALAKERELRQQTASEMQSEVEAVPKGVVSLSPTGTSAAALGPSPGPTGALWALPFGYRQTLMGLSLVALGLMVVQLSNSLPTMWRICLQALRSDWPEPLGNLTGLAGALALGIAAWHRREAWLHPLLQSEGVGGRNQVPGVDAALRWVLVGWAVCLGLVVAEYLVMAGWQLGTLVARIGGGGEWRAGWLTLFSVAYDISLIGVLGIAWRHERLRREVAEAQRMPAWAMRAAAMLLVLVVVTRLALAAQRLQLPGGAVVFFDSYEFVLLTVIAVWIGHRLYRAMALAASGWLLGTALFSVASVIRLAVLEGLELSPDPNAPTLLPHPWVMAGISLSALALIHVACLALLLAPSVRRAFGVVASGSTGTRKGGAAETAGVESGSKGVPSRENLPTDGVGRVLPEAWRSPLTMALLLLLGWVALRPPPIVALALALSLPVMLVREWFRGGPCRRGAVPGWIRRMPLSLVALGGIIGIGLLRVHPSAGAWAFATLGPGAVIATTIVALTTRGRYWRAVALPLNGWLLVWVALGWFVGVPTVGVSYLGALVDALTLGPAGFDPSVAAGSYLAEAASSVAFATGLVSLCLPSARAAFGIAQRKAKTGSA